MFISVAQSHVTHGYAYIHAYINLLHSLALCLI